MTIDLDELEKDARAVVNTPDAGGDPLVLGSARVVLALIGRVRELEGANRNLKTSMNAALSTLVGGTHVVMSNEDFERLLVDAERKK